MTASDGDTLWHLAPPDTLVTHRWSGRALVYNDLSGHTHLLDEMTTIALDLLSDGPLTESALVRRVADLLDLEADAKLTEWADEVIAQLEMLDLISAKRHDSAP